MALVEVSHIIDVDVSPRDVFVAITDYAKYPKYMLGVKKAKIQKKQDKHCYSVRYDVSLFGKEVSYVLDMKEVPEKSLTWTLSSSKYLSANTGGWKLKPKGKQKCSVTYSLELELSLPVPSFMVRQGAKSHVRDMLEKFKDYCESKG